ncbi:unnamed protein product [Ilex paraguariensis]|uniref:Uncharacterized protein n=1 Tax=Ilex paraguariensis TaxID=185542 RepID=A0ABC8T800_9AQUA
MGVPILEPAYRNTIHFWLKGTRGVYLLQGLRRRRFLMTKVDCCLMPLILGECLAVFTVLMFPLLLLWDVLGKLDGG